MATFTDTYSRGDTGCEYPLPQNNVSEEASTLNVNVVALGSLLFRITGPQSIERLKPLVSGLYGDLKVTFINEIENVRSPIDSPHALDFVWETFCEQSWQQIHSSAIARNKLHNTTIIEDKSNLAFLQLVMARPTLTTFIAFNATEVIAWAQARWSKNSQLHNRISDSNKLLDVGDNTEVPSSDWWVVKASRGNGGRDIWMINERNFLAVGREIAPNDEYVIQKYVESPSLWRGKKFHFRCYTLLQANMSALVYQMAYVLTAGMDYDCVDENPKKHITNLSVNKSFPNHPGQVPCNLLVEYPQCFTEICDIWREVAKAAQPFMTHQVSEHNFEFFGIDIIADDFGRCWMVEANRLPGLESSKNNKDAEDRMYDEMMTALLRIVLDPIVSHSSLHSQKIQEAETFDACSMWHSVYAGRSAERSGGSPTCARGAPTHLNTFSWKAFTKKNRQRVLVSAAAAL